MGAKVDEEGPGGGGWANPDSSWGGPSKPGGWGGSREDPDAPGSRHSSWEEEDGNEIGMWHGGGGPPQDGPSYGPGSNNWGGPGGKRLGPKGPIKNSTRQEEVWVNRLIKQLTDIGFPREPAEEALRGNGMNVDKAMSALLDRKGDLDKHRPEFNGVIGKGFPPRPNVHKESSFDHRSSFFDKSGLGMMGGGGAPSRLLQQPQSLPQPGLRAQVPPAHILPTQVQAQLLQYGFKNGTLNPALLALIQPQMTPQQLNLLNQLTQLQMAYQRMLLQQQMLQQTQRHVSAPIRHQQEQQAARTMMSMQQQIHQHQRQLAQMLGMKQPPPPSGPPGPSGGGGAGGGGGGGGGLAGGAGPPGPPHHHQPQHPHHGSTNNLHHHQHHHHHPQHHHHPGHKAGMHGHPHGLGGPADGHAKDAQAPASSSMPMQHGGFPMPSPTGPPNFPIGGSLPMGGVVGDLGGKDLPQSRLHQWTMQPSGGPDPFPGGPGSPLDPNPSKFGPGSIPIGPPPKPSLDDGPFNHYDLGGDPVRPSGSLGDGWPRDKSPGDKMANGTNSSISWPPEFRPGEPWKGLQNIDPDNDPDITPGSVIGSGLTVSTSMRDVDRFMLRDRNPGPSPSLNTALPSSSAWSYSASNTSYGYSSPTPALNSSAKPGGELKGSSWPVSSTHTPTTLTHELWKVPLPTKNSTAPSRPPPGLPNPKNPSPWGTGGSLGLAGPGWAAESSSSGRASTWLVLRNLTPQIDGSTLRTLCMQHGPLTTFHLNLPHGNALVKYSSLEEAGKAQKSLHMCVLGNTTIVAEFASEEEISRYFAQGQASASPVSSWQQPRSGVGSGPHGFPRGSAPGSTSGTGTSVVSSGSSGAPGGSSAAAGGGGGGGSSELGHWASQPGEASSLWGLPQYPSGGLWGTAGGEEGRGIASPSPLLPNDLLGNESM